MKPKHSLNTKLKLSRLLLYVFLLFMAPAKAYAYIDPGSGSYILQLILAGLLAASLAIKSFWRTIFDFFTNFLKRKKKKDDKTES